MANYSELLNDINAAIYENNDQEIDALEVRAILREMVTSLGRGFLFKGIATPSSPSGTGTYEPDQNVFYLATTAGTYTYLGGLVVEAGEVAFLCFDGTWTKKSSALLSTGSIVDNTTTEDATKPLSAKQGKVLADAGAATAAEVTALGHKVGLNNLATLVASGLLFDQGKIYSDGTIGASSTTIRTALAFHTPLKISVPDGFKIEAAYYFSSWTSNRVFSFNQIVYVNGPSYEFGNTYPLGCFTIVKTDGTAFTPEDFLAVLAGVAVVPIGHKNLSLVGISDSASGAGATNVGDIYYNTGEKLLRKITQVTPSVQTEVVPFDDDMVYIVGTDLYVWDGTNLVIANLGLIKKLFASQDIIRNITGTNLFDPAKIKSGYYINSKNTEVASAISFVSSYIPVKAGVKYAISRYCADAGRRCVVLDANLKVIWATSANLSADLIMTMPDDAAYFRFSGELRKRFVCFVQEGEAVDYTKPYIGFEQLAFPNKKAFRVIEFTTEADYGFVPAPDRVIKKGSIMIITSDVATNINTYNYPDGTLTNYQTGVRIAATDILNFRAVGTAATYKIYVLENSGQVQMRESSTLSIDAPNIKFNNVMTFEAFITAFTGVTIQHGTAAYNRGAAIQVDTSDLIVYTGSDGGLTEVTRYAHGLTIDTFIKVDIRVKRTRFADVIITTLGGVFSKEVAWSEGCMGNVQATPKTGTTFTGAMLRYFPEDLKHDIWAYGDSYFDYWPSLALADGYGNFAVDSYSGRNSQDALRSLVLDLSFGRIPKAVLWCMGMNDADSGAVNSNWKSAYDSLVELSQLYGFEIILSTVPNVPGRDHSYKDAIVAASGYRYVDVNKAVGGDVSENWYTGLKGSGTDVHPSTQGAKVIAAEFISCIPELVDKYSN